MCELQVLALKVEIRCNIVLHVLILMLRSGADKFLAHAGIECANQVPYCTTCTSAQGGDYIQ